MKMLATDLDRTLLPNGRWPADERAIPLFNELTESHGIQVVYVTGRNLALSEAAIAEFGIRYPEILIGDVGTSIRRRVKHKWEAHSGWIEHVGNASPNWEVGAIRDRVAGIDGLVEQAPEHCGPFKQSYYVEHQRNDQILAEVRERVEGRFDEVIVYSYDPQSGDGLLDFLPDSATKQTALEFVADEFDLDKSEVVFCGDSGNDVFPLTAGFAGVLVRNADEQLVQEVRRSLSENPSLRVYFAKGGFRGLSGYYTSGVIEGADHYGLFAD